MAAPGKVRLDIDPTRLLLTLRRLQREAWELEWYRLTGAPWAPMPHIGTLTVRLDKRYGRALTDVVVDGTNIHIPVISVTVAVDSDRPTITLVVPLQGAHVVTR